LPHQFKSVAEFERKIAEPIGRTWNPEHKFRQMTLPRVKTKLGAIIQPIDKSDIVKKNNNDKNTASRNRKHPNKK
jgi:U3 small nucleolar RNA-associated protein 14